MELSVAGKPRTLAVRAAFRLPRRLRSGVSRSDRRAGWPLTNPCTGLRGRAAGATGESHWSRRSPCRMEACAPVCSRLTKSVVVRSLRRFPHPAPLGSMWRGAADRIGRTILDEQVGVCADRAERVVRWRFELLTRLPPPVLGHHHSGIHRRCELRFHPHRAFACLRAPPIHHG